MFAFIGQFVQAAIGYAVAHPDLVKKLWQEITDLLSAHAAHTSPGSQEAIKALHDGIAAAAASVVATVAAREAASKAATESGALVGG